MNEVRHIAGRLAGDGALMFGTLVGLENTGLALVRLKSSADGVVETARSIVELSSSTIGAELVLAHDPDHPDAPVILGVIRPAGAGAGAEKLRHLTVELEGETLSLSSDREVTIRCGQASLRLTQAGKIELRGTQILTRATGTNKIKGGSISLN